MLLVANLVPAMALMVLVARRVAIRRAARSEIGGQGPAACPPGRPLLGHRQRSDPAGGDLRLAAVPERRRILVLRPRPHRARKCRRVSRRSTPTSNEDRIQRDVERDGRRRRRLYQRISASTARSSPRACSTRSVDRDLTETAVINVGRGRPAERDRRGQSRRPAARTSAFPPRCCARCAAARSRAVTDAGDRVEAVIRLDPQAEVYLYALAQGEPRRARARSRQARSAASDYQTTLSRSRTLQFRFNAALLLVSLLIVAICDLDRADAGRPAGAPGRAAGRCRAARDRRRPVGAGAGVADATTRSARSATPSTG